MKKFLSLKASTLVLVIALGFGLSVTAGCSSESQVKAALQKLLEENPKLLQAQIDAVLKEKGIRGRPPQKSIADMMKNPIKVSLNNAPVIGAEDAEITIIEFSDFQCPFCSRVVPTMKQLLKDYDGKIRVAFRQNPLSFHKQAMPAAKAALAAGEQGQFWEMHDLIFADQRNLTDENFQKMAKKLGLNMKQFNKDRNSDKFDAQIQEDIKFARSNGATGTPAFFVNGIYVKGAKPLPFFKQLIDKLLAENKQNAGQ